MGILSTIGKILIGLFGLGIMIFIHELGHLIAAKLLKVKVETFSLGYGKKLIGFRMGETTYQIAWFPFGGFCKMKGEHVFAKAVEQNLDRMPPDPDNYFNTPPWKRIIISIMGPIFNLVFAAFFFTAIFWIGFTEYSYDNRIILSSDYLFNNQELNEYPANKAGLESGDRIIAINGKETRNFLDLQREISLAPNRELELTIVRGTSQFTTEITPRLDTERARGVIGIGPSEELVVDVITAETAALNPWLQRGDKIIKISGTPVENRLDVIRLYNNKSDSLPAVILRDGQEITENLWLSKDAKGTPKLEIGFKQKGFRTPVRTLPEAFIKGLDEVGYTISSIFTFFALIPQKINVGNAIGGPIKTTYLIGEYASEGLGKGLDQGIVQFIQFLSWLSIILFIMNLLPLPFIDGGFVILFLIEWIRRKPFKPKVIFMFQMVGIIMIAILLIFVVVNDIFSFRNLF